MMQFDVHTGRPYDRINKLKEPKQYITATQADYILTKKSLHIGVINGLIKENTKLIGQIHPPDDYTVT